MDSQRQQASERIKQANNILVTVSNNPSVDQLAACIGLTVSLNKMGKHATAVFSGDVPSTLEFLQPEKTIEKNTDSLRDFIIALDKSKADKLRYKVEDRVVKIFITPYRTSITNKDLEFSQGDFNVDVVVAIGVHNQDELDFAITSHGRILHDATIVTLNTQSGGELGSINWLEPGASSLSELAVELVNAIDKTLVDGQVATAFLTGIVAETERFSNAKTTPQTMSISAQLMSSGANQQLVATKLEEPVAPPPQPSAPIAQQEVDTTSPPEPVKRSENGELDIAHDETKTPQEEQALENAEAAVKEAEEDSEEEHHEDLPAPKEETPPVPAPQIRIDEHGSLIPANNEDEDYLPPVKHEEPAISHHNEPPKMILEPPTLGGPLTANSNPGAYDNNDGPGLPGLPNDEGDLPSSMGESTPSVGPTIMPPTDDNSSNAPGTSFLGDQPLEDVTHGSDSEKQPEHPDVQEEGGKTLSDIERDVHSSHLDQDQAVDKPISDAPPVPVVPPTAPEPVHDPITAAFNEPDNSAILPPVPSEPAIPPDAGNDNFGVPNMPIPNSTAAVTPAATAPSDDNFTVDSARDAVAQAMNTQPDLEPIQALNAQPMGAPLNEAPPVVPGPAQPSAPQTPVQPWTPTPVTPASPPPAVPPMPQFGTPAVAPTPAFSMPGAGGNTAPPAAPPPMMPPMPPA